MAVLSGKDATWTIATALNGKAEGWELTSSAELLETTGAGDSVKERVYLHGDWEVRMTMMLQVGATYDAYLASRGAAVAFALKLVEAHTSPWITGTGILENIEVTAKFDEAVRAVMTIRCNGTDLTNDTTPA
jgi:hypothetical protein